MSEYLEKTGQAYSFASIKATLFNTALNTGIMFLASLALQALIKGIDTLIHHTERMREKADEAKESFKEINNTFAEHKKTVEELADRYDKLYKGILVYNGNIINKSLSTEEFEEFLEISEQLVDSFPSLFAGIDKNGNSILNLGTKGITAKEQLEELLKTEEELNNFKISQSIGDAFNGVLTYIEEADKATEKLKNSLSADNFKNAKNDNYLLLQGNITNKEETDFAYALQSYVKDFLNNLSDERRIELEGMGLGASGLFTMNIDELTGNFDFYANLYALTPDEIAELEALIGDDILTLNKALIDQYSAQNQARQEAIIKAENEWRDFLPSLVSAIKSKQSFKDLDADMQDIAIQIVEGLDYSIANELNNYNPNDPYAYIRDKLIVPMGDIDDSDKLMLKNKFQDLFKLDKDDLSKYNQYEITRVIEEIAELLEQDTVTVRIALGFDVDEEDFNPKVFVSGLLGGASAKALRVIGEDENSKKITEGFEVPSFSDQLTESQEALDKFQASVKSAYDAYSTLMSGNYSASDLLDSIQAINKAATDMGKSINWEFIEDMDTRGVYDSMELLGDTIEYISEEYAKSVLSGAGIDVDKGFGQILANNIIQAQRAEAEFNAMNTQIDRLQSSYQTLTGIINSYNETGYISLDNLQSLLTADENLITMLQVENGQLVINQAAYENLTAAQLLEFKAKLNDAAAAEIEALAKNKAEQATNSNAEAANNAVAKLDAETEAFHRNSSAAIIDAVSKAEESGVSDKEIQEVLDKYNEIWDAASKNIGSNFSLSPGGSGNASKAIEKEADAMSDLNSQIDKLQSAYKTLCDVRDTYNEYGKITVDQYQQLADMGFGFLSTLIDQNGQLGLNAAAFENLANAKLQEMQIQLARNAIDTINGIKTETDAVEYLTFANENLRDSALSATEALLYEAQQAAWSRGDQQGLAADQIVKGYEASKMLVGKVEFGFDTSSVEKAADDAKETILDAYNEQKKLLDHMKAMGEITNAEYNERLMKLANDYFSGNAEYRDNLWEAQEQYHDYLESIKKTYNWIENLLSSLSKKTHSLIDKAEKFISWQKKNAMINRAIKAGDKEITQNKNAYQIYMSKANSVDLSDNYKKKIQEGSLSIEDLSNEALSDKIEKYQEWYNKAQDVLDTINDLYDQQRDLIRQKLDNVLNYYSDLDSYLSSVTSKFESLISLNDEIGKRSSLTDLIEQFASLSERLDSVTNGSINKITSVTESESSLGSSRKVAEAREHYKQEHIDSIQSEIDNLNVDQSGTYTKLLNNIAKTQAQIDKYIANGWDVKKSKQFDKLTAKLQDYYDLQNELDQYATSNTIANYNKVYTAYQKLQNKLDSGKTLSKSEQKKYDSYAAQIDTLRSQGQSALDDLYAQLAEANGTASKQSEADRIQDELDSIRSKLENTATYQGLLSNIKATEDSLADLEAKGYDNLTKKQKKTYDKLQSQLEAYYAKKEALDANATAANITEYNTIYDAWRKLQDKLDSGGNLTVAQWKKYNQYTEQLADFANDKASLIETLNESLEEALAPSDKLEQIKKAYEESAKGIYDSYQQQIDGINGDVTATKTYQDLLAKAQKLEQTKDTKGLTASKQAELDKYNAELEALRTGGMSANISEYMKTWESFYTLQQKLDKNGKLSEKDAKKYDEYKAKLDTWNKEKQDQINDLLSLMEDDLEQLQKTYTENISEAESEINDYYANLYSLAKQIAEYNISSLKTQLSVLESSIYYCKELLSLYASFSGDKLAKILIDLGEIDPDGVVASQLDIYEKYLSSLQEKYDKTLAEINEYNQLLGALDEDDFESSMELFNKAMESYREAGNTEMADKLQSVLDLLNERAIDADNWGEYADEWSNEWEEALASVKQELIGTASEIQEVNDALRELSFENITNSIDELEKATGILSSISGLIQDDWLFDDGELSEYGRAKAALLVSQLENAQAKANEYLKLYNEIQNKQDTYASDKAYADALNEALQNYYDSLGDAASLENSLIDLMKRSNEEELNSLKDIINARKKALQAKKEYYDYDKSIKNAQKDVDSLKAQISALESLTDATDAATKAKLAQLKAELKEKEDALQETKDEHTFNLQIDALDKLSDTLTDALDESSKSVEEILKEQRDIVESAKELYEESKDSVDETLKKLEEFYRGMGSDIDGTDYTPNTSVDNNSTSNDIYSSTTSATKASVQDKQTLDEFVKAAHEAFKDGILVRASDEQLFKVTDENMLNFMQNYQNYILPMTDVVKALPDFIRERDSQPLVINNHYDSLINVEGNVDKDVARLLPEQLRQSYEYTISRFTGEYKALHGGQLTVR